MSFLQTDVCKPSCKPFGRQPGGRRSVGSPPNIVSWDRRTPIPSPLASHPAFLTLHRHRLPGTCPVTDSAQHDVIMDAAIGTGVSQIHGHRLLCGPSPRCCRAGSRPITEEGATLNGLMVGEIEQCPPCPRPSVPCAVAIGSLLHPCSSRSSSACRAVAAVSPGTV